MQALTYTEWQFFHIWKKNPATEKSCPSIMIPDTVIYRWAQPYFWYFTSKNHVIMRKKKDKIKVSQVEEVFNINFSNSNIAGHYLKLADKSQNT